MTHALSAERRPLRTLELLKTNSFIDSERHGVPVVIVPTKYSTEPIDKFVRAGVTHVIFANQSLRTVVTAVQRILHDARDLMSIDNEIAPVSEVFRLQETAA